jgi:N-acetylglucosamine kinase-like BadF-type ATPase
MRAVLQAQDRRIEPTILTQMVLDHFGMSDVLDLVFRATQGLVKPDHQNQFGVAPDSGMGVESGEQPVGGLRFREFFRQHTLSRDEIASLCPVIVQAAQQGDWKAIEILKAAGEELGQLGAAVIKHLGMEADEFAIVPFGGVFRSGGWVLNSFQKTVLSSARSASVVLPRFEPVVGAVLLALNDCGVGLHSGILEMLECTSFDFPACRITQGGG